MINLDSDSQAARLELISHLHLFAVLPALGELCAVSEEARDLSRRWRFPLGFGLWRGPTVTIRPDGDGAGGLKVRPGSPGARGLTLLFMKPEHLNRAFKNERSIPPLPLGQVWHAAQLGPFFQLTRLLQSYLQPSDEALSKASDTFRGDHLRLTFGVLIRAVALVGQADPPSRHTLAGVRAGTVELRAPGLPATAWVRWDGVEQVTGGLGPVPQEGVAPRRPDAILTFSDLPTLDDALHGRLDPQAAVGLGRVQVDGLVPLADALSFVMDRVEVYLRPS